MEHPPTLEEQGMAAFEVLAKELRNLPPKEARLEAFHRVRDIAYGDIGSRNPFDVLAANKGTCSGKHALLRKLLESMDYKVQPWFATHDFSKFPVKEWPAELLPYASKILTDYHDFLKVNVDRKWVTVDAIFDTDMGELGFPVTEWDGESDVPLPILALETFQAEDDAEGQKKKLLGALPDQAQTDRKEFLQALTKWIDRKRAA
ncbi:MAG: hypothetical protein KBA40_01800 [Candidatus Peribacteraceae bacterium]|nr:hypothetical protein [Candidatus Peribacteraceae bacterium]